MLCKISPIARNIFNFGWLTHILSVALKTLVNFIYTYHAIRQLRERKIEKIWVEETIHFPDITFKETNRCYAIKKLNGYTLKVVYLKEKYIKIITAYFIK
ncbi:DUF4258 domain-containing protein [Candidatus Woesearchaeota archaeon]|nr:MAG: DUF4258 domain-containing protein [Candidatus Woesearchaeota archaeon]